MHYSNEQLWCAKYLLDTGALCERDLPCELLSNVGKVDFAYTLTKSEPPEFFSTLAASLRELWPAGEKDGKYPWRDSVTNLTKRLKLLWETRQLGERSIEECLTAARRYLNQFQSNVKYMKTLKYFILRTDDKVMGKDGRVHHVNVSTFADMLESNEQFVESSTIDLEKEFEINMGGELV